MIRVLQVFGRLTRGGLETFVMNLYRSIDRNKIQFDFLVSGRGGDYEEEVKQMGARIFYMPPRNKGLKAYNASLDEFFKVHAQEFAAIHQHASSLSSIEPLKYAAKYGVPIRIIHAHSSAISKSVKANFLHNMMHLWGKLHISRYATHYLGCSDKALDWLFKGTGVRSKAIMVNNGIKVSDYKYNEYIRKEVREEFGLKDNIVIGHVGNFIQVKNHEFLIKIFANIKGFIPKTKLMLVGDGPLKSQIKEQIDDSDLSNDVVMTGVRRDVNRLLQAIDIIVMPSVFEGLPVSLVEAQAAGLPLVISDTISHDVALTEDVKFISLSDPIEKWANEIKDRLVSVLRHDTSSIINEKGFGIEGISTKLANLYLGK